MLVEIPALRSLVIAICSPLLGGEEEVATGGAGGDELKSGPNIAFIQVTASTFPMYAL